MLIPQKFSRYNAEKDTHELIELGKRQKEIIETIVSKDINNDLILITGEAGSGKSFTLSALKSFHELKLTATTARAAYLIEGITIDSLLSFNRETGSFRNYTGISDIMRSCPRDIIVDEASMLGASAFEPIYSLLKDYKKRLILVGDFAQAAPVKDRWITASSKFKPLTLRLDANYRQGEGQFLSILNKLRIGLVDEEVDQFFIQKEFEGYNSLEDAVIIYASNAKAKEYNEARLNELNNEQFVTKASISSANFAYLDLTQKEKERAYQDAGLAHDDKFSVGAKIILTKNNYAEGYINSDVGTIVGIEPTTASVKEDNFGFSGSREVGYFIIKLERNGNTIQLTKQEIPVYDSNDTPKYMLKGFPIKLGWAVTVHKSQGGTFKRVHFNMSSLNGFRFAAKKAALTDKKSEADAEKIASEALHGLCYVALSRAKTIEGLSISGWNKKYVYSSDEVKDLL